MSVGVYMHRPKQVWVEAGGRRDGVKYYVLRFSDGNGSEVSFFFGTLSGDGGMLTMIESAIDQASAILSQEEEAPVCGSPT